MEKPDVDSIEGLSPAISIEQKTTSKNPRSTVGTVTEIYDYLRSLYPNPQVSEADESAIRRSGRNVCNTPCLYARAPRRGVGARLSICREPAKFEALTRPRPFSEFRIRVKSWPLVSLVASFDSVGKGGQRRPQEVAFRRLGRHPPREAPRHRNTGCKRRSTGLRPSSGGGPP